MAGLQQRRDTHDRDMAIAWHVAALSRQKKLPPLERLLTKRGKKPPTIEQQVSVLHALSAQYGIPLRKRKRETKEHRGR